MTAMAQALSAALLHFIWQGALVAAMLWIALTLLRNRSAHERYLVSCAAMALMAALPAVTIWMSYRGLVPATISATISTALATPLDGARVAPELSWIALWRQWALPAWSAGVFVFALRLALGCREVTALRRRSCPADGAIVETVSQLARRMKTSQTIRVLISNASESPSVVGWLRPAILLPAAALAGLDQWQLEAVLAHEIAHIRRHDYLVNLLQTLVEALLFYHPAVWWVSARMRHERELCCDDAAVAVCGDAIGYARALTSLERLRVVAPRLALGSAGGSLLHRIERLAGMKRDVGPSKLPGIAALALGLICFATTLHWANAQQTAALQQLPNEWGISVSTTGELQHRTRVVYPGAAAHGTVKLQVTLDQSGNVSDAMVMSGPADLRKAALQSVLQWQYANGQAGETQQVSIAFQPDPRAQQMSGDVDKINADLEKTKRVLESERDRQIAARAKSERTFEEDRIKALKMQLEQLKYSTEHARENQAERVLELQSAELKQKLADLQAHYTDSHPDVVQQKLRMEQQRIEALEKLKELETQMAARYEAMSKKTSDTYAFRGATLSRIEVRGLSESERNELTKKLPVHIGDTLSPESMEKVMFAVASFNERLLCQFLRAEDGSSILQIDGPTAFNQIRQ